MNTVEKSVGKWRQVLFNFGVRLEDLNGKHTACPMCGGVDRFRFDNKAGSGSYFCTGCGNGYGIDLAIKFTGRPFKEVAAEIDKMIGNITPDKTEPEPVVDKIRMLANYKRTINECGKIYDPMRYLKHRNINTLPNVYFHPGLPFYEDGKEIRKHPAMLGILQNAKGEGIALHRTYINDDLTVTRKLTRGSELLAGSAIRLYKVKDVLGVAEGIETACSAHQKFNVPVWSVVSSSLMESFVPPEGIKEVRIFGDNDPNYAGQKSAYLLATKLYKQGYGVSVHIPEFIGDYNDIQPAS